MNKCNRRASLITAVANAPHNFRGLERFRTEMFRLLGDDLCDLERTQFLDATLYVTGEAFSGISPWRALGLGVVRALRREACRLHPR